MIMANDVCSRCGEAERFYPGIPPDEVGASGSADFCENCDLDVQESSKCDVHDWPTKGLPGRLLAAMSSQGGVDACVPCLERAHAEAAKATGSERR